METSLKIQVRRIEKPPYIVDKSRLKRFKYKDVLFERVMWDKSWKGYRRLYNERTLEIIKERKPGYSRIDFALAYASWIVHDAFKGGFSWNRIKLYREPAASISIDWSRIKQNVDDPHKMSLILKRAAKFFGADLIGICRLNRDWLYEEVELPEQYKYAIVMAIEMDPEGIATSPSPIAAAATGVGYSKMAFLLACMGEFIRNLGYNAIQCGNDTALSIPLAIDAGLGELGRNGLLITPEYGPRVRLCKIFTDMPLEVDKPIEFGVKDFCRKCKLCAENCEAGAISMEDEPSFQIKCKSNNPGALKWYVDVEKCYLYWCENGIDCSTCIKVCPYNLITSKKMDVTPDEFWKIEDYSK